MTKSSRSAFAFPAGHSQLCAVAALLLVVDVATCRGLFADGSNFVLQIIAQGRFYDFDEPRLHVVRLTQVPVVLGIRLGVTDIDALYLLHSAGLFVPTLGLYILAFVIARRDLFLLGAIACLFAVVYLNTGFFAIGEFNLAYAASVCALAIILAPQALRAWECALLVALGALLVRSYEALAAIGVLLFAACQLRLLRDRPESQMETVALAAASLLFAAAAAVGGWSILHPRDPANFSAAGRLSQELDNPQFLVSAAAAGCFLVARWAGPRLRRLLGIAAAVLVAALAFPGLWSSPANQYWSRIVAAGALVAIGAVMLGYRQLRPADPPAAETRTLSSRILAAVPVALVIVGAGADLYRTWGWTRLVTQFEAELGKRTGLVRLEDTALAAPALRRYGWDWAYPSMSVVLNRGSNRTIILNPAEYAGWQPFDPTQSPRFDLRRSTALRLAP